MKNIYVYYYIIEKEYKLRKILIFIFVISLSSLYSEENVRTDFQQMIQIAEKGNHQAEFIIGFSLLYGTYKNNEICETVEIDKEQGYQWIKKSAMGGYHYAQYYLGGMYNEGIVIEKDYKLAEKWFLLGAQNGIIKSRTSIAELYFFGKAGEKDINKAYAWATLAAFEGYENAKSLVQLILPEVSNLDEAKALATEYFKEYGLCNE